MKPRIIITSPPPPLFNLRVEHFSVSRTSQRMLSTLTSVMFSAFAWAVLDESKSRGLHDSDPTDFMTTSSSEGGQEMRIKTR